MSFNLAAKNTLFSLVLLDLLIFPYFQLIVFPYSLFILVLLFYSLDIKIYKSPDYLCFVLIAAFSSISCLLSIAAGHKPEFIDYNLKSLMQLLTSFLYLFAFAWYRRQSWYRQSFVIVPIYIFILYYVALMLLSLFHPTNYIEIVNAIYGKTSAEASDYLMFRRFPYFFSDPNTAIYFFIMTVTFLFYLRPCVSSYLLLVILGTISCIVTQSTGGIVTLILSIFVASYKLLKLRGLISLCFCISLLIFTLLVAASIINTQQTDNNLTQALDLASSRFSDQDRGSSGFGRIYHWNNVLKLPPLLVGFGHIIIDGSKVFDPIRMCWV